MKYGLHNGFVTQEEFDKFISERTGSRDFWLSGFEHTKMLIFTHQGTFRYEWGLIPFWFTKYEKLAEIQRGNLNSKSETIFELPSFKQSILKRRCLIGVMGFYDYRDFKGKKYPYHINVKSSEVFCLGGIYDNWIDKRTGEIRNTFSMVTTEANPLMAKIHNLKQRMPLIIPKVLEKEWLDPNLPIERIKQIMQPYDENDMEAYSISTIANSGRNNRNIPEILERVEYAELVD